MPIWDKGCPESEVAAQCDITIGNLAVMGNQLCDGLEAPCDAWLESMAGVATKLTRRLSAQAGAWLRRIERLAGYLDAAAPAASMPVPEQMPVEASQTAQDASGPVIEAPVQIIALDASGAGVEPPPAQARAAVTPVDIDTPAAYLFGEGAAHWHERAAAWDPVVYGTLRAYPTMQDWQNGVASGRASGWYPPPDITE
jgi:hypothetical protein